MSDWKRINEELPQAGVTVDTISPGGHQQRLTFSSGLWFIPGENMHVYYSPVFWREIEED